MTQQLLLLSTGAMALAISYPSAHSEIFRMTCTPDSSSIPYTVAYDSDVGASYITGGRSGTTRKYNVLDIKNKTSVHVLYVTTKARNQTRTIYLAFDYSGKGDDVSAIRVIDGASDKKDKCVFIPNQVVAQVALPQADSDSDKLAPAKALTLTMACEGYNVVFSPGSLMSHAPKKDRDYPITKVDVQNDRIVVTGVTKYGKITAFFSNDGHPSIVWTNGKDVVLNQCASDVAAAPLSIGTVVATTPPMAQTTATNEPPAQPTFHDQYDEYGFLVNPPRKPLEKNDEPDTGRWWFPKTANYLDGSPLYMPSHNLKSQCIVVRPFHRPATCWTITTSGKENSAAANSTATFHNLHETQPGSVERNNLLRAFARAMADDSKSRMAQIRACYPVDADDNVYFGGIIGDQKKFSAECRDATQLANYSGKKEREAEEAIIPSMTAKERCTAQDDYFEQNGVARRMCDGTEKE